MSKTLKKIVQVSLLVMLFVACSNNDEPSLNPTITNISPISGPKTTIVTITGNDFGTDVSKTHVFFNEVEAVVQDVTNSKITVEVPAKAFTGLVKVMLNGTELIGPEFTYTISDVQVSTLAGSMSGYVDGTGTSAQFDFPSGVAVDSRGNIYVADQDNSRIRKITPSGVVSTVAGSTRGFTDGSASNAQFDLPFGVAVDTKGNVYVADTYNHKIRKITPFGVVKTLAGSTFGFADGIGSVAQFRHPRGVVVDSENNIYVADSGNGKIRKITPSGDVSTLAGSTFGFADGIGANAKFGSPTGVAIDIQNNIYVVDIVNDKIRKITPSGEVSTLAGGASGFADGLGDAAQFDFEEPVGIAVDTQGNVYVPDENNHRIRKITPSGMVSTLAGSTRGFTDGTGSTAQFKYPRGVAVGKYGIVYVADGSNHKIRKITQE